MRAPYPRTIGVESYGRFSVNRVFCGAPGSGAAAAEPVCGTASGL